MSVIKGWKINKLIALHTLSSACAGIALVVALYSNFQYLEYKQKQIMTDAVSANELLRAEDTYRQWLVMMDLILGNEQTYLALGAKRQAIFFLNLIDLISQKTLPNNVQADFKAISSLIKPYEQLLDLIINGADVSPKDLKEFDDKAISIIKLLENSTKSIQAQAQQNIALYEKQHKNTIALSILFGVLFILFIIVEWLWITLYLVRPVQKLNNSVESAYKDNNKFFYDNKHGPLEVRKLAENAKFFINNLEEKVIQRTELFENEKNKAVNASKAKTAFLSIMSHELRTPLNIICGFSELLTDDPLTNDQQNSLHEITIAVNRLMSLLDTIFDFIESADDAFSLSLEEFKLAPFIYQSTQSLSSKFQAKNIQLSVNIPERDITVIGNVQRLTEVLMYLIENAIKFNYQDGTVVIDCYQHDYNVMLSIKDSGVGVKAELSDKLFTPFVERQKNFVDGLGISLYLSKRFIELMNGEIGFHSTEGEGSEFFIRLPASDDNS